MNIKYFKDTDTALLEFSDREIAETRDINENICIDIDASGNLVNMTIEHAKNNTTLPEVIVQEFDQGVA